MRSLLKPLRLEVDPIDSSPLPIDIDLLKTHTGVDGSDLDALLELYLLAAIAWAEDTTHRTIYRRGHRWVLEEFPTAAYQRIELPRGKTASVDSIVVARASGDVTLYGPTSGVSPTGDDFREDLSGDEGGVIMPAYGGAWPDTDADHPAPVVINFTAGWLADEVPANVKHAIMFAVSDALELRGSADLASAGPNFDAREALISGYRLTRWY